MKSRTALELLACAFLLGCGGSVFTFGDTTDAGPDVSSGGTGTTSSGTGTSSGTSGTASTTSSTGTSGTTSGTSSSTTVGTGGSSSTSGSGGAAGTGSGSGGSVGSGAGGSGTGGNGAGGSVGTGGAGGSSGKAGGAGRGGTGGAGGSTGVDAGTDWSLCSGGGQCVAEINGCCGPCGMPQVQHFTGVNSKYTDAFRMATCPMQMPCPLCPGAPNPYIAARCAGTHCQVFDTRTTPEFSKCATASDCRLRKGLSCCECGSQGDWTAVSVAGQGALNEALCAPMTGCPDCAPVPPLNTKAVCVAGHCEVAVDSTACTLSPRLACCFGDSTCNGRCYGAKCAMGSEGVCKSAVPPGQCWGDQDCPSGQACSDVSLCPCGGLCIRPDAPGTCK